MIVFHHSCSRFFVISYAVALAIVVGVLPSMASHGKQGVKQYIGIHGTCTDAAELAGECRSKWEKIAEDVHEIQGLSDSNQFSKIRLKKIAKIYTTLGQIERDSVPLQLQGEPLGVDLLHKAKSAMQMLLRVATKTRSTRDGRSLTEAALNKKKKTAAAREKAIKKIEKYMAEESYETGAKLLGKEHDKIHAYYIWLADSHRKAIDAQYRDVDKITGFYNDEVQLAANAQLVRHIDGHYPDVDKSISRIEAAQSQLVTRATCSVDGAEMSGPEALMFFFQEAQGLHLASLHCSALEWSMLRRRRGRPEFGYDENESGRDLIWQFGSAANERYMAALAGLISADAARAEGAEAKQLYERYLVVVAPLLNRVAHGELKSACAKPLTDLLAKNSLFQISVEHYRESTSELLKWRNRVALSRAQNQAKAFPAVSSLVESYAKTSRACVPHLDGDIDRIMKLAPQHFHGQAVRTGKLLRLSSKSLLSPLSERLWVKVAAPSGLEAQVEALKADLMLQAEGSIPLTLEAAASIATAQENEVDQAGGTVNVVYLEAMIPRLATLPEQGIVMVDMGYPGDGSCLRDTMVRVEVTPSWVQHKHFFMELEVP